MELLLVAVVSQLTGGAAAAFCSPCPRSATLLGAGATVVGCLLALAPTLRVLLGGPAESWQFNWDAVHGVFRVELDALSSFFLLPTLGLAALAAIYGGNYLLAYRHERPLGGSWFFFNVFVAGMVLVLVARTVLVFLVAWEVMSLAAFFLVTFEHDKVHVYLVYIMFMVVLAFAWAYVRTWVWGPS